MKLTIKTTEWIKCLWQDLQVRNLSKKDHETMNDKEWISKNCLLKELDKEIEYLENHVKKANEGIKINVERVNSWIFQTKKIKELILK